MDDFKQISVTVNQHRKSRSEPKVNVINPTHYPMIGSGAHGAVFLLNKQQCVKIFALPEIAEKEAMALQQSQDVYFVPRFYEKGPNYIIMEYIRGMDLAAHLSQKGFISESITMQILNIIHSFQQIGFTKMKIPMRHIIVTEQEKLKVIDLASVYDTVQPYPLVLLFQLKKFGVLDKFLLQIKKSYPDIHADWLRNIPFNQLETLFTDWTD